MMTELLTPLQTEHRLHKEKAQFSLRAMIVLTASFAVWVWIFREIKPGEMAVLTGIVLMAGIVAHVVYAFWLPWRVTVIATVLLLYNVMIGALTLLQSGSSMSWFQHLEFLYDVVVHPAKMMMYTHSPRDLVFSLAIVLGTVFFTPAHAIRPSLPTAIITALGIAIWYGSSIMMMAYGG